MTAVTLGFVVSLTALEFESDHFLVAELLDNLGGYRSAIDKGAPT